MSDRKQPQPQTETTDARDVREKEGHGLVPNITPEEAQGKEGELKEALHELEEAKGDWAKGH
jgi:hypothetical protein